MQQVKISGRQKTDSEIKGYLETAVERPTYLAMLTSVHGIAIQCSFRFRRREYYDSNAEMKFCAKFTFAVSVECLRSNLQTKLLMHNCARAKQAEWNISVHDVLFKSSTLTYMSDFYKLNK